jgi:hypothetical protein
MIRINLYPVETSIVEQSVCGKVGKYANLDSRRFWIPGIYYRDAEVSNRTACCRGIEPGTAWGSLGTYFKFS